MSHAFPVQCHSVKWKKNPISGHEWPEVKFSKNWTVIGGASVDEPIFGSAKKATDHANYLNKCAAEI